MPLVKTKGLAHFSIPVTDTERSQKFYEDVLGFDLEPLRHAKREGKCLHVERRGETH